MYVKRIYKSIFLEWGMGFGSVFGQSKRDYQDNFSMIMKVVFVLIAIPLLIVAGIGYVWVHSTGYGELIEQQRVAQDALISSLQGFYQAVAESGKNIEDITTALKDNPSDSSFTQVSAMITRISLLSEQEQYYQEQLQPYTLTMSLLALLAFLVGLIGTFGILAFSVRNKRFSFQEVWKSGKKFYWKYLGASVLVLLVLGIIFLVVSVIYFVAISGYLRSQLTSEVIFRAFSGDLSVLTPLISFLIPYFLLLLITLSPLLIYWIFTLQIISDEGKGVFASLGKSMMLVRGKWLRTFWQVLSIYFLVFLLSLFVGALSFSLSGFGGNSILKILWKVVSLFIIGPFILLFLKNLYLEAKHSSKANKR